MALDPTKPNTAKLMTLTWAELLEENEKHVSIAENMGRNAMKRCLPKNPDMDKEFQAYLDTVEIYSIRAMLPIDWRRGWHDATLEMIYNPVKFTKEY